MKEQAWLNCPQENTQRCCACHFFLSFFFLLNLENKSLLFFFSHSLYNSWFSLILPVHLPLSPLDGLTVWQRCRNVSRLVGKDVSRSEMSVLAPLIALCVGVCLCVRACVCPCLCEFDACVWLRLVWFNELFFGGCCCVTFVHLCVVILDLFICTACRCIWLGGGLLCSWWLFKTASFGCLQWYTCRNEKLTVWLAAAVQAYK